MRGIDGRRAGLAGLAIGAGAALGGLAWWSGRRTREAERANPPMGAFIEIDGMALHYVARGEGRPVVFIHGLAGMVQDWQLSLLDRAAREYKALAFDRPGSGYSERPGRWSPERQAGLLRRATRRMGLERPVVVGHSFGALVALAWAIEYPSDPAGLVLLSGYFYPTGLGGAPLLAATNSGRVGAIARNTVSPALARALAPKAMRRLFAPSAVPEIMSLYPVELALRPSQMRADAEDLAGMRAAARRLSARYGEVRVPVVAMAGDSDRVMDPVAHTIRLHRDIPHSALRVVPGAGHMLHHVAGAEVMDAIELAWHEADVQSLATLATPAAAMEARAG